MPGRAIKRRAVCMTNHVTDRSSFLATALMAAGASLTAPPLSVLAQAALPQPQTLRPLAPVKVARDRIIRTVVGLRPFSPEGFVVRAERVGNKLLVHNY